MTIALTVICILLAISYAVLMLAYRRGWRQQKDMALPAEYKPFTRISVIIPARNEEDNIGACIESVLAQRYPTDLFEIIVVDDHSEDRTAAIIKEYADRNVRYVSLAEHIPPGSNIVAYKKAAIAAGIDQSNGTLIVTTDADCMAPNAWLQHIAAIYEQDTPVMIVAPVIYTCNHSLVQIFQLIDLMSMQGITAASHSLKLGNMSNGANLAFRKTSYERVGGYEGISHMASGDDLLLMMKMDKMSPHNISYLRSRNAIVSTKPQPDWKSFIQQRIRWASKSGKYDDKKLTSILLLVYLFNLSFLVMGIAAFFNVHFLYLAITLLIVKTLAEILFITPVARYFGDMWTLRYFAILQPLHILYIIIAGFLGFKGGYVWKGRSVK